MIFLYIISVIVGALVAVLLTNFSFYPALLGAFIGALLVVIHGLLKD